MSYHFSSKPEWWIKMPLIDKFFHTLGCISVGIIIIVSLIWLLSVSIS